MLETRESWPLLLLQPLLICRHGERFNRRWDFFFYQFWGRFLAVSVLFCMCLHQQQNCKSFHRFWHLHASLLQVCFDSNMFGHSSSSSASFSNHSWQKNDRFLGIFPEHIDQVDYFLSPKLLYLSIKHCLGIKLAKNDHSLMTMTDTKS